MISIEKCKEILNKSERKFTDDEVKKIRDYLYIAATIENDKFKTETKKDSSNIH
ncbi:hypothetical protein C8P67_105323 [Flavobacterium aquicola]|uniref:Uncharacterized protein n=1 Tax=Flavobacterium aquicola TaxID=1682742 RepID=A0A3E0ELV4_9FLAO|nr:hypothetical protein C8P67_105323 [Flavobacterium aquicola]